MLFRHCFRTYLTNQHNNMYSIELKLSILKCDFLFYYETVHFFIHSVVELFLHIYHKKKIKQITIKNQRKFNCILFYLSFFFFFYFTHSLYRYFTVLFLFICIHSCAIRILIYYITIITAATKLSFYK